MKRLGAVIAAITVGVIALAPAVGAKQDENLHCPDGGVKVEATEETQAAINDLVLEAGTILCVKAGPGNTGVVTADGETDLQGYLFAAGIKNGSETDGRDVSYYVVYETPATTTTTVPEVTTTTVPEVTTTTVPEVTTTTVPEVTTTTVPEVTTTTVNVPATDTPAPIVEEPVVPAPVDLPEEIAFGGSWTSVLLAIGVLTGLTGLALLLLSAVLKRK